MIFMEENDLRNAATKDVATQGGQYDIMTVGAYEVPIWGQNRWLVDLTDEAAQDPAYDVDDFFQPVRDGVSVQRTGSTRCRSTASRRSSCTARICSSRRA